AAFVDEIRVPWCKRVLEREGAPVEDELLELRMGGVQQRSTRGLVHATRLHPDQPVLDQVDTADAVQTGDLVQALEQWHRGKWLAVHACGEAVLEPDRDVLRPGGRLLRRAGEEEEVLLRLEGRILERTTLVRHVPDVAIAGVDL